MRNDICIYLSPSNRARLERLVADRNTRSKVIWRAGIVLATADGLGTVAIMRRTGKSKPCVWRWQERYVAEGVEGLLRDKTRPSRKKPLTVEVKLKVLTKTANEMPANATHWSVRTMAKEIGISHTSVQRIWTEAGLKPHLIRKFKLSNDPKFAEKVTDVVGLYMSLGDRKHRRNPDKERERDLTRRCIMSLGNLDQDPSAAGFGARKIAVAEGAVGRHRQTVTDTPGKHRMFNSPLLQVIKNLIAGDIFARWSCDAVSLLEIIGVEVADTPG